MIIAGIAILVFTWMVVVFTIVLPRGQWGPARLSTYVTRGVRLVFSGLARLTNDYERKDTILAPIGPIAVITQLLVWLALFTLGFALMLEPYTHNFWSAISQVGAAMFTLGRSPPGRPDERHDPDARGGDRAHRDRTPDRVPALALRRVQPPRVAHDVVDEPRRRARVGTGDPDPAPARRHHRRAARLLRLVGAMGRRSVRVTRELRGVAALPIARPVVVVGAQPAVGDGRGRDAPRVAARERAVASAHVPAHGLRRVAPDLELARVGSSTRIRCPTIRSS